MQLQLKGLSINIYKAQTNRRHEDTGVLSILEGTARCVLQHKVMPQGELQSFGSMARQSSTAPLILMSFRHDTTCHTTVMQGHEVVMVSHMSHWVGYAL